MKPPPDVRGLILENDRLLEAEAAGGGVGDSPGSGTCAFPKVTTEGIISEVRGVALGFGLVFFGSAMVPPLPGPCTFSYSSISETGTPYLSRAFSKLPIVPFGCSWFLTM